MSNIHLTAIIDKGAEIAEDVIIGPYTVIDAGVKINSGNRIGSHCYFTGLTTIGKNNNFYAYASVGTAPQDIGYKNEPTRLIIGDNNTFREFVTLNRATTKENGETIIGSNNFLMAYAHVGHDCVLSDNIIIANATQLGGHVRVAEYVGIGGLGGVHHLVSIGAHAYIGGAARIIQDVPPFMITEGHPGKVRAINSIGLERRGFSMEVIAELESAFKLIWRSNLTSEQVFQMIMNGEKKPCKEVTMLVEFLQNTRKGKHGRYLESLRKTPAR